MSFSPVMRVLPVLCLLAVTGHEGRKQINARTVGWLGGGKCGELLAEMKKNNLSLRLEYCASQVLASSRCSCGRLSCFVYS